MPQDVNALVDGMQICMLDCMPSTSIRIDTTTHQAIKALAGELQLNVGDTVRLAIRRLQQASIGAALAAPLTTEEIGWLDADFR
jgi:hypothetical protein